MRAIRGQGGQTGAEYAGVLLVIVLLAGALAGPGRAIGAGVAHQVSCIAHGGTCAARPAPAPADLRYPTAGTPIGDGQDVDVLPFPGSASLTPLGSGAEGSRYGVGVGVKATLTSSSRRGQQVINAKGCPMIALSVTTELELTGTASGGSKTAGFGLEGKLGQSTTYTVNASPDQVAAMEAGGEPPNPLDPRTLTIGGGIVLGEETYKGWNASAQLRGLVASSGVKDGQKAAVGVTRLSDSTVRISVGDEQFVERAAQLGIGVPGVNVGFAGTSRTGDGALTQVDLDIASPEGWAAYQAFIADGRLPAPGAAGVTDSAQVDQDTWTDRSEIVAQAGPAKSSLLLADSEGTWATEHHPNGAQTVSLTSRDDDLTLLYQQRTDALGNSSETYGLLLDDVDSSTVAAYEAYQGTRGRDGGAGTLAARVDFTGADLLAVQQQVYRGIANANRDASGGVLDQASPQEVEAYFKGLGENEQPEGMNFPNVADQTAMEAIATAGSPEEILGVIARQARGNPDEALAFLGRITSADLFGDPAGTPGKAAPGALSDLDGSGCS